ncbi:hypothetical protein ABPG73_012832 [Tetrahymena malaccensis]
MQIFRKLNVEDNNSQDQQKGLQKLSLLVQKNNSHFKGVGFIETKHKQMNTISDNFRITRQAKLRENRCKDEIIENARSVTLQNQSFFSNSSQFNSPLTTRVNSPTQQSEADFLDYFVLGSIDQSQNDKRSYHKQSKSAVNPKQTQHFGTSTITEQLSLVSQEQFKLVNQSSGKLNKFFLIELQKAQSIQKDFEYAQILQRSAQINGQVNHSSKQNILVHSLNLKSIFYQLKVIYNQTPLKMMLFKDSVEYYKLECKNKQFPLRIHCTDLTAPFLLAISARNKYPKPNANAHEYLIQFDTSGSKKLEFQSLQRYIINPNNESNQQVHQNSNSLDNRMQNPNKTILQQTKTHWIYFSFIGQQFSSFTITTEFQDDISFKFFNEEIFKPQKHIPQKQVSKMIQAKNEKYLSLAQLQKFNKEALQIIKRRKEETLKKSNNIDIVELNKSRAKQFLNLEYEKFLNKNTLRSKCKKLENYNINKNINVKHQSSTETCDLNIKYKSENEKAKNLLQTIFQEIRMNKKIAFQKNEEQQNTSVFSQLNPTVVLSFAYFLQQFSEGTKKKICRQYITLRKQIFRQQYKKHNELLEDFQVKLEQYKQKIQMLEEYKSNMIQTPQVVSKNWSNVRKISLAVSLFSGNQLHKKQLDLDKSQIEQTSPFIRQKTSSFASSQSQLNSPQKSLNTPRNSSKLSRSNSPQSNKNQKDTFNFNNAFDSFELSQSQVKQIPSPLAGLKQKMSIRNSLFSPQNKIMEEKIEEPRFTSKKQKLNLESRKEMEEILLQYLTQQKEKHM